MDIPQKLATELNASTLTPAEVARELHVARSTVDAWIHRGRIRTVRVGAAVLIPLEEVRRMRAKPPGQETDRHRA